MKKIKNLLSIFFVCATLFTNAQNNSIGLGAGIMQPSKNNKDTNFLVNSNALNLNLFKSLLSKNKFSFGLNVGLNYAKSNTESTTDLPAPYIINGQTSSNISLETTKPTNTNYKIGIGPQFNFGLGKKIIISPILMANYFSYTQNPMSVKQTTLYNGQTYTYNIFAVNKTTTSTYILSPKLKLAYKIMPKFSIWAEGSYDIGQNFTTNFTKLKPEGLPTQTGNYDLKQLQNATYIEKQNKTTNFSFVNIVGGIAYHFGTKNKEKNKEKKPKPITQKIINPNPASCTCGSWSSINFNGTLLNCGNTYSLTPDIKCNDPISVNFDYSCMPSSGCTANITYEIFDATSLSSVSTVYPSTSGTAISITAPSVPGSYYVLVNATCFGSICAPCKIYFNTACSLDCCTGSTWGAKNIAGIPSVTCGTAITTPFVVSSTQVFNYTYNCNTTSCTSKIIYTIKDDANSIVSSVTANSGINQNITMPSKSGNYCMVAYGQCNGVICDSCVVCFKVTCNDCVPLKILPISGTGLTHSPITNNIARVSLNFSTTAPKLITKIVAQLESIKVKTHPFSVITLPNPNFEFTIVGNPPPVPTVPFSILGSRSNIAIFNLGIGVSSTPIILQIDNIANKDIWFLKIKFTTFYNDGTFCESYKQW